ncbi:MAG: S41 family peptidase [Candidatus Omnitrophica bacterium]|nr:S41 family peptidase [Candidatus Omnitrophota bacterium]
MRKNRIVLYVISIAILVLMAVGTTFCEQSEQKEIDISELYKEIELFSGAISFINTNYVKVIKPKELIYGALRGMLASLDGYSQFMDPDSYKEMKIGAKGRFGGLGIEIGVREGMLTIISPIDGTPAAKAGLLPRDVIVKINGESTRDIVIHEAVKKLRGKPGTSVSLSIWRDKEKRFFEVTITREIIKIKSVKVVRVLEEDIGYIKLAEFQEKTGKELEERLKELKEKNIKGLILDLRNNPGGLLNASIDVSDLLLEKGKIIVSTKGRNPSQNKEFKSRRDTPYTDITLVVLVNEGSASASEIVAGAIKDNGRGIILGEKTFGKGSVQTVVPLKDGSALRITTAEYFTPKGYLICKRGIIPDIVVEYEARKIEDQTKKKDIFKDIEKPEEAEPEMLDNQLKAALDVVKGINIYKNK